MPDTVSETPQPRKSLTPAMGASLGATLGQPREPARKPVLRKKRGQGASRRGEILNAAKRVFIAEGFANATMRRIAAEVGVSPTALYLHFADKEAILQAIADDYFSELLVLLKETQASDLPPLARLRSGLRAFIDFGLQRTDEYRLTFQSRAPRGTLHSPCADQDVADTSFQVLEDAVTELIATGIFRQGEVVTIAETIFCCLHGVTSALIDMPERVLTPTGVLIDSLLDAAITGFTWPVARDAAA